MTSEVQTLPKGYEDWHPKEENTIEKIVMDSSPLEEQKESQEKKEIVDFSKCQIEEVIKAYLKEEKVEGEYYSPYLSDHNTATGELLKDKMPNHDKIGIEIAKELKAIFPRARMISLYDEYNSDMPDSANPRGMPTREGRQIEFPDEIKENFRNSIKNYFKEQGIIKEGDVEGKNYLLVSESSKIEQAEELVDKLRGTNLIREKENGEIWFDDGKETFLLKTKNGRWQCPALDASAFLNPHNRETTHLVILPENFKAEQDQVWAILTALDFKPTNYHNIYYKPEASPDEIADKIVDNIIAAWRETDPQSVPELN